VTLRAVLILGSLVPGLAKATGHQAWFGVGIVCFAVYLFWPGATHVPAISRRFALVMAWQCTFVLYALGLASLLWWFDAAHDQALMIGILLSVVPLMLCLTAGTKARVRLVKDLPAVGTAHALIALVIYPAWRPDWGPLHAVAELILDGTMAFRMASVSGSLGFATLMMAAMAVSMSTLVGPSIAPRERGVAFGQSLLFLGCGFLTLQRAAWLALVLIWCVALHTGHGRRRPVALLGLIVSAAALTMLVMVEQAADLFELIGERLASLTDAGEGAVAERADQWLNAWRNLIAMPAGFGPGQVGQPVRDVTSPLPGLPVYDGDYFRLISEYGVFGVAQVVFLILTAVLAISIVMGRGLEAKICRAQRSLIAAGVLGLLLQCLGTNVTELYFVSIIFWAMILLLWDKAKACPVRCCGLTGRAR